MNRQIVVLARLWRDVNGNSYHNCRVYVDNKLVGYAPYEYGYGSAFEQTALSLLEQAGIYPPSDGQKMLWQVVKKHGDTYLWDLIQVSKRADLYDNIPMKGKFIWKELDND